MDDAKALTLRLTGGPCQARGKMGIGQAPTHSLVRVISRRSCHERPNEINYANYWPVARPYCVYTVNLAASSIAATYQPSTDVAAGIAADCGMS